MQDTSGVHVWLVLTKAFHALMAQAAESLNLSQAGLGDSEFRVLEVLLHKGPLPVNTIGPKVWLTPGPPRTPGRTHGERTRARNQDFSKARDRNGGGCRRPVKRGAADLAAAAQETWKRRAR